jgi:hypothetical protein
LDIAAVATLHMNEPGFGNRQPGLLPAIGEIYEPYATRVSGRGNVLSSMVKSLVSTVTSKNCGGGSVSPSIGI